MRFEQIHEQHLPIALTIYNSNPSYNCLENGKPTRSIVDMRKEFLHDKTESYLIYSSSNAIGILDFLPHNPKDGSPWIGLMMVDGRLHSAGYGEKIYRRFEERLIERSFSSVRLAVLTNNESGKRFWRRMGFTFYQMSCVDGNDVECLEKSLS